MAKLSLREKITEKALWDLEWMPSPTTPRAVVTQKERKADEKECENQKGKEKKKNEWQNFSSSFSGTRAGRSKFTHDYASLDNKYDNTRTKTKA